MVVWPTCVSSRPKCVVFAFLRDLEDGLEGLGEVQERVLPHIRGRLEMARLGVRPFVGDATKCCSTPAQESWWLCRFLIPCMCVFLGQGSSQASCRLPQKIACTEES